MLKYRLLLDIRFEKFDDVEARKQFVEFKKKIEPTINDIFGMIELKLQKLKDNQPPQGMENWINDRT